MFARIRVDLGTRPDCIVVPERAVTELQGRYFVWTLGAEDKATQRAVKVGARLEGQWLIEDGLKVGDRVIVEGTQKVREGSVVTPMTAAEMAQAAAALAGDIVKPAAHAEKSGKPGKE